MNQEALLNEYLYLQDIHLRCDTLPFFKIPRPYSYNNPASSDFRCIIAPSVDPKQASGIRQLPFRPIVSEDLFSFPRATYAMERVLSLPPNLTRILRNAYFPQAYISPGPKICRLYPGKSYPSTPGRFFNSENFPLDVARYTHLRDSSDVEFPELSEVAEGIGEMLGRFHFIGGYNARDVEFVLGGNVYTGFSFYLIDFNQVSFIYIYISV